MNEKIILYRDINDVTGSEYVDSADVVKVVLDYQASYYLKKLKARHLFIYDLLDDHDLERCYETMYRIIGGWKSVHFDEIEQWFNGVKISDIFKTELFYFSSEAAASIIILEKLMETFDTTKYILCKKPTMPNSWLFYPFVFESIAWDLLERNGKTVYFEKKLYNSQQRGGSIPLSKIVKKIIDKAFGAYRKINIFYRKSYNEPGNSSGKVCAFKKCKSTVGTRKNRKLIITVVSNIPDFKKLILISKELIRRHEFQMVFLVQNGKENEKFLLSSEGLEYVVIEDIEADVEEEATSRMLKKASDGMGTNGFKSSNDIINWIFDNANFKRYHFQHLLFKKSKDLILAGIRIGAALDALKPDAVLNGLDWHGLPFVLSNEANKRNIPTISFMHGGVVQWHNGFFSSQYTLVWGQAHKDRMEDQSKAIVTGNTGYDNLFKNRSFAPLTDRYEGLTSKGEKSILVMPAAPSGEPQALLSTVNFSRHLATWKTVLEIPIRISNVRIFVKPHPRHDLYPLYDQFDKEGHEGVTFFDRNVNLSKIIRSSDLCMAVNMPTDAVFESIIAGKPTIMLCPALVDRFDSSFNSKNKDKFKEMIINNLHDIHDRLEEIFRKPECARALEKANQSCLSYFIGEQKGNALEKTLHAIHSVVHNRN